MYDDDSMRKAQGEIEQFRADFGTTFLGKALNHAYSLNTANVKKRIFVLTDGYDHEKESVLNLA